MTIKELREKYHLSQSALAKAIGVSSSAVAAVETGRMKVSQKIADAVKAVYGEVIEMEEKTEKKVEKVGKKAKETKEKAKTTKKKAEAKAADVAEKADQVEAKAEAVKAKAEKKAKADTERQEPKT